MLRPVVEHVAALAEVGIDLLNGSDWQAQLAALEAIDWSKKNPEWEGVCVASNSVLSNRQARAATKAFIKAKLGMKLTDSEAKSLPASPAPVDTPVADASSAILATNVEMTTIRVR